MPWWGPGRLPDQRKVPSGRNAGSPHQKTFQTGVGGARLSSRPWNYSPVQQQPFHNTHLSAISNPKTST